jgi:hypothetical protein
MLLIFLVSASACSKGNNPGVVDSGATVATPASSKSAHPASSPIVRLVDSLDDGAPGDPAFPTYRVQVTVNGRTDTIAAVRTHTEPLVGPDGRVYGFGHEYRRLANGYIYTPDTRALATYPTPPGVGSVESHVSISPDARHIAYISEECARPIAACGVVRSWPAAKLIAETPGQPWCEGDEDYNDVRWLDDNRAEFIFCPKHRFWIYALVAVDTRLVKLDTLASKPDWKR